MNVVQAVVLGLLQGLTEFLPVSSSGHLVLGQYLFGVDAPGVTFDVFVHVGSLLAVLFAFRDDVWHLLLGTLCLLRHRCGQSYCCSGRPYRPLVVALLAGSVPAAVAGLALKDFFVSLFDSVRVVGYSLLVTGVLLYLAERRASHGASGQPEMIRVGTLPALVVGFGQALAIVPGLSRSGTTISAALLAGLDRETAARFSFLLSIPAILGGGVVELPSVLAGEVAGMPLIAGMVAAALSGYAAIRVLLGAIRRGRLWIFSLYVWILGLAVLYLT